MIVTNAKRYMKEESHTWLLSPVSFLSPCCKHSLVASDFTLWASNIYIYVPVDAGLVRQEQHES